MKKGLLILSVLALSNASCAYQLSGDFHINDDDTYSVQLFNNVGRYYIGSAEERADGSLDVRVQDMYGEEYSGTAKKYAYQSYVLQLQNDATGKDAQGTMKED